jgi:hypothetical protein
MMTMRRLDEMAGRGQGLVRADRESGFLSRRLLRGRLTFAEWKPGMGSRDTRLFGDGDF